MNLTLRERHQDHNTAQHEDRQGAKRTALEALDAVKPPLCLSELADAGRLGGACA
jgi:hypothetical protein